MRFINNRDSVSRTICTCQDKSTNISKNVFLQPIITIMYKFMFLNYCKNQNQTGFDLIGENVTPCSKFMIGRVGGGGGGREGVF